MEENIDKEMLNVYFNIHARGFDSNLHLSEVFDEFCKHVDLCVYVVGGNIGIGCEGPSKKALLVFIDNAPMKLGGYYVYLSIPDEHNTRVIHQNHYHISGSVEITAGVCYAIEQFKTCIVDCFGITVPTAEE